MVKEIRIYFEGDSALKPGFHKFLSEVETKARSRRWRFQLIAAGGTPAQDYRDGRKANPDAWNFLLLDSDETIAGDLADLCARKDLAGFSDSVFWMAQIMEAWFLTDPESLSKYYRDGFRKDALVGNPQVEQIPKSDVYARLRAATQGTQRREYHKTRHAPDLLAKIKPELVRAAAPHCKRLFNALLEKLSE
jgi:hypothetical protein